MRVYLDNNVLVDIEEGVLSLSDFCSKSQSAYFFSEVHMDELMNGLETHPELKGIRLKTLGELCRKNYILPGVFSQDLEIEERDVQSAYDLSLRFKFLHDQIYQFTKSMKFDRDAILNSLVLEKKEVGNYKPEEVLGLINEKMNARWGYDIPTYLKMQDALFGRTEYNALFNLLDFVCYWRDKSHVARLYDASHAYFAQKCDVLVSNDKRMRYKAAAVYSYFGVNTKVVSAGEFLGEVA